MFAACWQLIQDKLTEFLAGRCGQSVFIRDKVNTLSFFCAFTQRAKNDILIFEDIKAKIILVECGFLSNKKECDLLQTSEYHQKISEAIWQGINEILCLEMPEKIQVIDSANKGV